MKISVRGLFWLFALSILILLGAALLHQPGVTAQELPDEKTPTTRSMDALLRDRQPVQSLAAMAATPCVNGFAGSYPCHKVDLLSFLPLADIGGGSGNDVWGWTDPQTGNEYALMGRSGGTSFVDVTDPENPVYLGNLPGHNGTSSTWRDIKVYANHAYVVSESGGHGIQIFDLTQLRNVTSPPVTFSETAHFSGFGSAHNIVINEDTGFAYGVGTSTCSGGLHMVDIQNPTSPTDAGCFSSDGYTHDAQCVVYQGPDPDHQGKEICFNSNEDTLTIVDVTNKSAPVQLSRSSYTGSGYTHQGWANESQTYFLLSDELDESNFGHNTRTYLWNISDLDSPTLIGNHTAATAAIDHNLYVKGDFVFQSNYRAGLRILDITDMGNGTLTEEAFFDIYPSNDNPNFNGSWSNYPYFDSGVVLISGIEQGLFVVRPRLAPDFNLQVTPTSLDVCVPDDGVYQVSVNQFEGFSDPVTLSTVGEPAGTAVLFNPNSTAPPFTSTLTISNTGAAAPGGYPIDIVGTAPTATHTATVQLVLSDSPPATTTLQTPADGATNVPTQPSFTWSGDAVQYTIEIATDPAFANVVLSDTVGTNSYMPATDLNTSITYFWRVTGSNACGTGATSATFSFTITAAPGDCGPGYVPNSVYFEDFDSGAGGWTTGGSGSTWALSGANPYSGSQAFHADNVGAVSDQHLESPAVTLPAGEAPLTLQFWNYQELEDGGAGCYDGGVLEISTDGGSSWTRLESELLTDPYDGPIDGGFGNPLAGQNAWCGDPQPYLNSIVDLDAYAGQAVNFRFRLATDTSVSHPGWDVDDVKVQSCQPSGAGVVLPPDMAGSGNAGATVTYTLSITNTGTAPDTYTLDVVSSWPAAPSTFLIAVPAGDVATFSVMVTIPAQAATGASNMTTVSATSHANGSVMDEAILTTTALATPGIIMGGNTQQTGMVGSVVTYTLHITNSGNLTDTFTLSQQGAVWPTILAPVTMTMPAGTGGMAQVGVTIPITAVNGAADTAVLAAISGYDTAVSATLSLTTTAIAYTNYLPFVSKPAPPAVDCTGGTAAGFPCQDVSLLSFLSLSELGAGAGEKAANLWGWTDPATGRDYVLLGLTDKMVFVDASVPTAPSIVGYLPNQTITNPVKYRDVKVYQNHAFIIADEQSQHGMQVFDLTQLRDVTTRPATFAAAAVYTQFGNAHNIFINEDTGYAYVVRNTNPQLCNSAVYMLDVRDPLHPAFAGCYDTGGAASDTMCVVYNGPDAQYQGQEICLVASDDEILVADVTDKGNPATLATLTYPDIHRAHLAWLTEDHRYFVSSDMNDEMMLGLNTRIFVWDFTQVENPTLKSIYVGPTPASDHNIWVEGDYAYVGNFRAGVRILDLTDIENASMSNVTITEAAYFDVYPADDNTGHVGGAWAVYPFFDSGLIAVSDKEAGLYLLRPSLP